MIVVYYVVQDIEVIHPADINRKELTIELAVYCFEWVVIVWTTVFVVFCIASLLRRRSFWSSVGSCLLGLILLTAIGFIYYSNLTLI